ncbi:hypothetical protein MRB53_002342 [Persea americana]|uniref:Uncharacterized protein n=1 Tax=Persea americana TaxID=3435 RepID=A0ACC2MVV5_PERAE|nr:hypothetical protein MRB53_002342 [Persea americana]
MLLPSLSRWAPNAAAPSSSPSSTLPPSPSMSSVALGSNPHLHRCHRQLHLPSETPLRQRRRQAPPLHLLRRIPKKYKKIVALEEEPNSFNESKFQPPFQYDYLYCGSSLYGGLSAARIREWMAYHTFFLQAQLALRLPQPSTVLMVEESAAALLFSVNDSGCGRFGGGGRALSLDYKQQISAYEALDSNLNG